MSTVSVVIPCFGQPEFLSEAVESVLSQTRLPEQIIIASGCNKCTQVARGLAADYPTLQILDGLDRGVAHARNVAIEHATGQYILPLDADDKIDPIMLESCMHRVSNDPYVIVTTDMQYFGDRQDVWHLSHYSQATLMVWNSIPTTSLYSKSLWAAAGGYDVSLIGYEDWNFWISCSKHNPVVRHIPEKLFRYRVHGGTAMTDVAPYDGLLRAMIRVRHPDLYPKAQIERDCTVIEYMPKDAFVRLEKKLKWFPDNSALHLFRDIVLNHRSRS